MAFQWLISGPGELDVQFRPSTPRKEQPKRVKSLEALFALALLGLLLGTGGFSVAYCPEGLLGRPKTPGLRAHDTHDIDPGVFFGGFFRTPKAKAPKELQRRRNAKCHPRKLVLPGTRIKH